MKKHTLLILVTIIGSLLFAAVVSRIRVQREEEVRKLADKYRAAAERGDVAAEYELGRLYYHGTGVPLNYEEALTWYRKAADREYPKAENGMGNLYANGYAVPKDDREADIWYKKAAEHGYAGAQYNLGYMYENGRGVQRDRSEAERWYRKAAEQGDSNAQHALGKKRYLKTELLLTGVGFLVSVLFLVSPIVHKRNSSNRQKDRASVLLGISGILYAGIVLFEVLEEDVVRSAPAHLVSIVKGIVGLTVICVGVMRFRLDKPGNRTAPRQ